MTARSHEPPAVLVVMGVAGAGKTTVGRALATALARAFYDADDFHPAENVEKMRAGVALTDADRAPWLAALRALIEALVARRAAAVIACSALREAYRAALTPRGPAAREVQFVFLDVAPAVAARRLASRRGHFMPVSLVESQFAVLEPPRDAIRVDASLPVAEVVARASAALRERSGGARGAPGEERA